MTKETTEYILLANAHITQKTNKNVKSDWSIEANITNEQLGTLPPHLTEQQAMAILKFARKFELDAFNAGIQLGKEKQKKVDDDIISNMKLKLRLATEENIRIAEALDKATRGK